MRLRLNNTIYSQIFKKLTKGKRRSSSCCKNYTKTSESTRIGDVLKGPIKKLYEVGKVERR